MPSLLSDDTGEAAETGITPGGTTGAFRDVLSKHHGTGGNRQYISQICLIANAMKRSKSWGIRNSGQASWRDIIFPITLLMLQATVISLRTRPAP